MLIKCKWCKTIFSTSKKEGEKVLCRKCQIYSEAKSINEIPKRPFINIEDWEIYERFIRNNRWFIRIKNRDNTLTLPYANYIWLQGNLTFKGIPRGYVIHHLDLNELNDDISNLSLMYKHYHHAYHLKHINAPAVPIKINHLEAGTPVTKPIVAHYRNHYVITFMARENGKRKSTRIYNKGKAGQHFKNKEEAEAYIGKLWPDRPWLDNFECDDIIGSL